MKRPIVTLSLIGFFAFPTVFACNQAETPEDDGGSGSGNATAGMGNQQPLAGSGPAAGSGNPAPTAGSGGSQAMAGSGAGGMAGSAPGGSGAGMGGAAAGSGGGPAAGCPVKIDSKTACTQVIDCPGAYCGVHQLGSKNCNCAMATGMFMCSSCDYTGKTEEIVQAPAAALEPCASEDSVLEDTAGCTKGMRCKSLDTTRERFCACWDDLVEGGTAWDCDSLPSAWQ
jgi:hypothetical protein